MNGLNFKPLIEEKITQFLEQNPEYTYGQLVYSVGAALGKRVNRKSDFLNISDQDFYTALDLAMKKEKQE